MYAIRRLKAGEADLYRDIRLQTLRESPEAFATTYESALRRDEASWVAQADASAQGRDRATFVILAGEPVGLAALYRDSLLPAEGELLQMWIAPGHRGTAAAALLLDAVLAWASSHDFHLIRAEVTAGNTRALRFYERHGFQQTSLGSYGPVLARKMAPGIPAAPSPDGGTSP